MKGKIKWYNDKKGYGFISGNDDKDIFIHNSNVPEGISLKEDDEVEYTIESTDKGLKAVNLTIL